MANGEILDDGKFTLAFQRADLNRFVLIENLDNGLSVVARITDRGGFDTPQYNRIADLSLATKNAIDLKTDVSTLRITLLANC